MEVADWSVSPPVRMLGIFDDQHRSIRSVLETGVFPLGGTKARRPAGDQPGQGHPTPRTEGRLLQLFEIPVRKPSPELEPARTTSGRPFPCQQIGQILLPQVLENLDCPLFVLSPRSLQNSRLQSDEPIPKASGIPVSGLPLVSSQKIHPPLQVSGFRFRSAHIVLSTYFQEMGANQYISLPR